jgi:uncharacterized protein (TIGR02231 family)
MHQHGIKFTSMKKILLYLLALPVVANAQTETLDSVKTTANITHATVYYGAGAALEQTAKATVKTGISIVVINDIGTSVDANTLQISVPENVVLLSHHYNYYTPPVIVPEKDATTKLMEDSIKQIRKQISIIDNDRNTNNAIIARISKMLDGATGQTGKDITSDNIIKLADYYQTKLEQLNKKQFENDTKKEELNDKIADIEQRIISRQNKKQAPAKTIGQLILQVMATSTINAEFGFSYFTPSAGWIASYDMKVKTADNHFTLVYKANVHQQTGLNWRKTKLTLSTGTPNNNNTLPQLSAWYLQEYFQLQAKALAGRAAGIQNDRRSLNVNITGLGAEVINDKKELEFKDDVSDYLTLNESQLNVNFEIDLPYDIPTDGQDHQVFIKDENIKATYKHFAIPKLDADAFLAAEIADWENLNLLPGNANIIMDNVYLGKSYINTNTTIDTLNISLGRDKRIAIKRMLVKDLSKTKIKGDSKTESFMYEITVKNNKKYEVNLLLKDQVPVSTNTAIEVTVDETSNSLPITELGILNWKLKLAPGETKKIRFGYSVKYPKDKQPGNLK